MLGKARVGSTLLLEVQRHATLFAHQVCVPGHLLVAPTNVAPRGPRLLCAGVHDQPVLSTNSSEWPSIDAYVSKAPTCVLPIRCFKANMLCKRESYHVGHLGDIPLLVRLCVPTRNGSTHRQVSPPHEVDNTLTGHQGDAPCPAAFCWPLLLEGKHLLMLLVDLVGQEVPSLMGNGLLGVRARLLVIVPVAGLGGVVLDVTDGLDTGQDHVRHT